MAFKMNGMNFGNNMGNLAGGQIGAGNQLTRRPLGFPKNGENNEESNSNSKPKYTTKTKTGRNLFGQKRTVTKYFDPETGKKVGKKVQVTKKDGTKKMYKDRHGNWSDEKTKRVNTGLTREGGIGKIREAKGYFDTPSEKATTTAAVKPGRIEHAASKPELKEFVKKDPETGDDKLASYREAWDDDRFKVEGGKRTDKFGNVYSDDEEGYKQFETASKQYWSDMAEKTKNEELRRDTQTGKMDSAMPKKKRGYRMKGSSFKNYKKGYYGAK